MIHSFIFHSVEIFCLYEFPNIIILILTLVPFAKQLRKYNDVIELCEKTMKSSEINSSFIQADDPLIEGDTDHIKPYEIWRWHVISRSYFYLGKLEEVIKLLQCHNLVGPIREEYVNLLS